MRMRTPPVLAIALTTFTLMSSLAGRASFADPATERTEKLIAAFKKVKAAPEGKPLSPAERKANEPVYKELDRFFAFDQFGDACIGPAGQALDKKKALDVRERLVDVLRRQGYANAGAAFSEGVLKFGKPRKDGDRTISPVAVNFPKQDLSMTVDFVWGGDGKVVDLILDDDSLSQDLSNQIARILKKSGVDELTRKLSDKQAELAKEGL